MGTCARNMYRHEIKLIVKQILCIKLVKYWDKKKTENDSFGKFMDTNEGCLHKKKNLSQLWVNCLCTLSPDWCIWKWYLLREDGELKFDVHMLVGCLLYHSLTLRKWEYRLTVFIVNNSVIRSWCECATGSVLLHTFNKMFIVRYDYITYFPLLNIKTVGPVAQSVWLLTTGWTVRDRIPVGKIFSACPDRPWGPPRLLYNGYRVFPGGKVRPERAADHSPPSSVAVMEQ